MKEISFNKERDCNEDVFAMKKESDYMFLTTPKFKFLDVKNYIVSGLSYDAWCKLVGCKLQKLMFLYKWLDSYEKLSEVGPVGYEDFHSSLKTIIEKDEHKEFFKVSKVNDCTNR